MKPGDRVRWRGKPWRGEVLEITPPGMVKLRLEDGRLFEAKRENLEEDDHDDDNQ